MKAPAAPPRMAQSRKAATSEMIFGMASPFGVGAANGAGPYLMSGSGPFSATVGQSDIRFGERTRRARPRKRLLPGRPRGTVPRQWVGTEQERNRIRLRPRSVTCWRHYREAPGLEATPSYRA